MITAEMFKQAIIEGGVLDPEGVHHEFTGGMHGRKLHFDRIKQGTDLYDQWLEVNARKIFEIQRGHGLGRIALVGVADGTNGFAADLAGFFKVPMLSVETEKVEPKMIRLTDEAKLQIKAFKPATVFVIEDVGTTGNNSALAAHSIGNVTSSPTLVLNTWQRRPILEKLEAAGVPYTSVINDELPTYTRDVCMDSGYCRDAWNLIKRPQ